MIVDAHCHGWERWPYQPPVPDGDSRGRLEQLLFEMDKSGIDRAVIICAGISHNPDNNDYVASHPAVRSGRLVQFADVDSRWTTTFHAPGAAERLRAAIARWQLAGFTHYLREETDDADWLLSAEGDAFLDVAERAGVILSLACGPGQLTTIGIAAARHPALPFLLHHMARIRIDAAESGIRGLIALAAHANIAVKVSGFGYAVPGDIAYPYDELAWVARVLHGFFGAGRLCWASDYPVSQRYMTYRQTLDVARRHYRFMSDSEREALFGGTMARLLVRGSTTEKT